MLLSCRQPLVETYIRNINGGWSVRYAGPGEDLVMRSIDARVPVDSLYQDLVAQNGRMILPD